MLALLSSAHGYLAAFLLVCFVIGVSLVALATIYAAGLVARWDLRRRHPELRRQQRPEREPFIDLAAERKRFVAAQDRRAEDLDLGRMA